MQPNPDPAEIPEAIWYVWQQEQLFIPGVRLGGIVARKVCYHSSVKYNQANHPGAYCIRYPLDLVPENNSYSRALDSTMSDAEMVKRTGYLVRAALHPQDNRLQGLREFIGFDGARVVCYIRNTDSGPWTFDPNRDETHEWHIHKSWWTKHCANMQLAEKIVSVERGVTWEEWSEGGEDMTPEQERLLRNAETYAWKETVGEAQVTGIVGADGKPVTPFTNVPHKQRVDTLAKLDQLLARPSGTPPADLADQIAAALAANEEFLNAIAQKAADVHAARLAQ